MTTIFWAGDSTVQYNSILTYPQTGMGQVLDLYLKPEIVVENHGKNGRSTRSFIDENRLVPIYDHMNKGDFLFIQFGHNDGNLVNPVRYTDPFGEYSGNLVKFINLARNKEAWPVLITPLERRCYLEDGNTLGPGEHGDYVKAMKQVADKEQIPLIDLWARSREKLSSVDAEYAKRWYMQLPPGVYPSYPDGLADNTHLKYEGAVLYTGCIADGLRDLGGRYKDLLLDE